MTNHDAAFDAAPRGDIATWRPRAATFSLRCSSARPVRSTRCCTCASSRDTMLDLFQITRTQLGYLYSALGTTFLVCYLPSGWLADRLPPRWLISFSLAGTARSASGMRMRARRRMRR